MFRLALPARVRAWQTWRCQCDRSLCVSLPSHRIHGSALAGHRVPSPDIASAVPGTTLLSRGIACQFRASLCQRISYVTRLCRVPCEPSPDVAYASVCCAMPSLWRATPRPRITSLGWALPVRCLTALRLRFPSCRYACAIHPQPCCANARYNSALPAPSSALLCPRIPSITKPQPGIVTLGLTAASPSHPLPGRYCSWPMRCVHFNCLLCHYCCIQHIAGADLCSCFAGGLML